MEKTESSEHILENEIDETINDAEEIESQPRAKRGKGLVYDHLCDFESFETISEEIKNGKIDKYWYDCSFTKHGCKVRMFLLITSDNVKRVFVSNNEHDNHEEDARDYNKVPQQVYEKIVELEGLGQKPKDIKSKLVEIGLQPPKDSQITYLLRSIRSKIKQQTSKPKFKILLRYEYQKK
ncbi:hypothetical protein BpHYR1_009667 [Brachionus plicatilis]|uniref:Uncharacterized protein n=1 Tax=Brachionus plicatilis TaxID=10195 RepID=A0A3M7SJG9_BRAPC|nr:hypothetical protein BpHYR1_009667 [Brachionus plicatilis]